MAYSYTTAFDTPPPLPWTRTLPRRHVIVPVDIPGFLPTGFQLGFYPGGDLGPAQFWYDWIYEPTRFPDPTTWNGDGRAYNCFRGPPLNGCAKIYHTAFLWLLHDLGIPTGDARPVRLDDAGTLRDHAGQPWQPITFQHLIDLHAWLRS